MSFERSWCLLFLALVPVLLFWAWQRRRLGTAVALKAAMLALAILALSEPRMSIDQKKVSVAVLVDTSASVSRDDLQQATKTVRDIENARGSNSVTVIPFARAPRETARAERESGYAVTSGEAGRGTNIEAALRHAAASLPGSTLHRIVLISDGHETEGNVTRAAWMADQIRVPIDTFPLSGRPAPALRIDSVSLPALAFSGEKFPLTLSLTSPKAASATIELSAEGKPLGTSPVSLTPGSNQVRLHTSLNVQGAVDIAGRIKSNDLGEAEFRQAIMLRRPRLLLVSQDPAGSEAHIDKALKSAQFDVQLSGSIPANLAPYQIVTLNNIDLEAIPAPQKDKLEKFVKEGGGLLVIGGEKNVYDPEKKVEHALDRVLPAKIAPPRSPEGTCVVLILDKSSSMEGRKMELARQSAVGVILNLRPVDFVGVLIFDNSFQWAVPIRRAEDRNTIARLVAGVMPDGGTQIAPALAEGFRRIQKTTATYRHVVLLTDGISEEGDSINLAKEAATQRITISTVGLGQDVNRPYLERVASNAKGRSYFLTDPSGLEQILLKDVMEHTGSTTVEKPLVPAVIKTSSVLEGVNPAEMPALNGYVKFVAKPEAERILSIDEKDPLLTMWQTGLGRSAVFASDAKSRWAEKWVTWPGFEKFWVNLFRDLLPRSQMGEATLTYDTSNESLVADYKLAANVPVPARIPELFVFGPNGFRQPLPMQKVGEGAWRGTVRTGDRQGLFRVRALEETPLFPETGLYREEEELRRYGANHDLLRNLSRYTGGRFSPAARQVFEARGQSIPTTLDLWPGLLAAALICNLIELLLRKWRGIADLLLRRKAGVPVPAA